MNNIKEKRRLESERKKYCSYGAALHEPVAELAAQRDDVNSREATLDIIFLQDIVVGSTEGENNLSPVEAASQRDRAALIIP